MSTEAKLQSEIIKYLRHKGCYVIKHSAGPGVPAGCPDVSFYTEGFYGFVEVKAGKSASFQPLQKETVEKLDGWSWAKVVYPENWQDIKKELEGML
jgi:Holliday junction resolvase